MSSDANFQQLMATLLFVVAARDVKEIETNEHETKIRTFIQPNDTMNNRTFTYKYQRKDERCIF